MAANDARDEQCVGDIAPEQHYQSLPTNNNNTDEGVVTLLAANYVAAAAATVTNDNSTQSGLFTAAGDDINRNVAGNNNIINNKNNSSSSNISGGNGKKGRRRKRQHHNNLNQTKNNNKKWNKQFKRQKSHLHNNNNADLENIIQNGRNKHLYGGPKVPKIIYNKNIIHRGGNSGLSKFFLPDKRPRKNAIIPPTKFLLGGNISDPLNLNSLQDEALASMNAATPKSSPITTPPKIEVIIPPNICDPLHLMDPVDSLEYEQQLISPMKQRKVNKHRNRKKKPRKYIDGIEGITSMESGANEIDLMLGGDSKSFGDNNDSGGDELLVFTDDEDTPGNNVTENNRFKEKPSRDLHLDLSGGSNGKSLLITGHRKRKTSESTTSNSNKCKLRRIDSMDKIVSPVIPQPGAWKRPPKLLPMGAPRNRNRTHSTSLGEDAISPTEELNLKKCFESFNDSKEMEPDEMATSIPIGMNSTAIGAATTGEISSATVATAATETIAIEAVPVASTSTVSLASTTTAIPLASATSTSSHFQQAVSFDIAHHNDQNRSRFKKENIKYQYGNFTGRYGGIQSLNNFSDVRLTVFMRHAYLFKDKDILDIGCSVGHMTFAVARKLQPKSIMGIDIDKNLIARARRNLSLFVRIPPLLQDDPSAGGDQNAADPRENNNAGGNDSSKNNDRKRAKGQRSYKKIRPMEKNDFFPVSFPICYGGIPQTSSTRTTFLLQTSPSSSSTTPNNSSMAAVADETTNSPTDPNISSTTILTAAVISASNAQRNKNTKDMHNKYDHSFPNNVFFRTLNYVVTDESQLNTDTPQYDLIMCLSVTKWIHLNFGDAGLKMTFRRMFNQLRPGGKLILEAQNWASYKKRKKLTETIYNNYKSIEFFPNKFHEYLLSPEVGFSHSYALGIPRHASKGFYRPIQLYIKGDFTPSQIRWSDSYHPQTPYEPYRYYYADIQRFTHRKSSLWGSSAAHPNIGSTGGGSHETPYYGNRYHTPSHGVSSSTSQYYNPLETDSYLPSYDNEIQTRHYCFASPLYSTVWSPPSGRKSASQTPLFGSIRRIDEDNYVNARRHVYLNTGPYDGGSSTRSIEEGSCSSPQTYSSRSVRDADLDANTNSPKAHVYAIAPSTCNENSSSPRATSSMVVTTTDVTSHHSADVEPDDAIIEDDT